MTDGTQTNRKGRRERKGFLICYFAFFALFAVQVDSARKMDEAKNA
jgi:hypothetical protein